MFCQGCSECCVKDSEALLLLAILLVAAGAGCSAACAAATRPGPWAAPVPGAMSAASAAG